MIYKKIQQIPLLTILTLILFSCADDNTALEDEMTPVSLNDIKVSSFNIRFANPSDGFNRWENRRDDILSFLQIEDLDIIGMQEVLYSQTLFFEANLTNYTKIGVGRDDGKQGGEYAPLYIKNNRFDILDSGNFWLSESPEVPSKGWDAVLNRICTYAHLYDIETSQEVFVFNTHYDHVGSTARVQSSSLILDSVQNKLNEDIRVILTGDLNVEPGNTAYNTLANILDDSFNSNIRFGPQGTYNGFNVGDNHNRRIDYILFKGFKSNSYKTISTVIDGRYLSDHFPIISNLAYRPLNN
ncbi:endonuclease [Marivirga lumbricoides]|uniref:Endonuclease n=1 Tax=Marivirga lumbricoides TaxID=1046115 RepID=A0ABQ1MI67_9BACT|nr:endonuclease [Marivirga lumbricoides]